MFRNSWRTDLVCIVMVTVSSAAVREGVAWQTLASCTDCSVTFDVTDLLLGGFFFHYNVEFSMSFCLLKKSTTKARWPGTIVNVCIRQSKHPTPFFLFTNSVICSYSLLRFDGIIDRIRLSAARLKSCFALVARRSSRMIKEARDLLWRDTCRTNKTGSSEVGAGTLCPGSQTVEL